VSEAASSVWREQRLWSVAANRLKTSLVRWRVIALTLTILGAVLIGISATVTHASPLAGRALSITGAVVLAIVPVVRYQRLARERVRDWTRVRSVSEAFKKQIYLYLARAGDYAEGDRDSKLLEWRDETMAKVIDLERYLREADAVERNLPDVDDAESYARVRVDAQIRGYYRPKAEKMGRRLSQFRALEFTLALSAAGLGAVTAAVEAKTIAAWVTVVTTASAAVTAHIAAERYEGQANTYRGTASRLEQLRNRWQRSREVMRTAADSQFVVDSENAISTENEEWMTEWVASTEPTKT
jgi:hypothetical protein